MKVKTTGRIVASPTIPPMHLLIPFAAPPAHAAAQALSGLQLPHLSRLLRRLSPAGRDEGDDTSLSPPHERALAQSLGLTTADGRIPWAALEAHRSGHPLAASGAWAMLSLCHWQPHANGIRMADPHTLDITPSQSETLLLAVQPYAREDGIELLDQGHGRWLAHGDAFADLQSASLDRIIHREIEPWMPRGPQAVKLLRLQNEVQMLFYTHAVNDERLAQHQKPINSVWIHGAGSCPVKPTVVSPTVAADLRAAALGEDWPAWQAAWQALDGARVADALRAAEAGQSVQLTLCGERHAATFETQPRSLWQRLTGVGKSPTWQQLLTDL